MFIYNVGPYISGQSDMFAQVVYDPKSHIVSATKHGTIVVLKIIEHDSLLRISGSVDDMVKFRNVIDRVLKNPKEAKNE